MLISVYMPSALFQKLYAKFYMLDCNMPTAMTIAMSFSMTTEQVGHLIIYAYLLSGYDSPYCCYREEITIHHGFGLYLRSQVFQFVSTSGY
jgi:hypothetical protein